MNNVTAIILAGGIGSRMKSNITKQNIRLLGKTVFQRTLEAFCSASSVTDIIVVARKEEFKALDCYARSIETKKITVVEGGKTRAHSAKNGFLAINENTDFVAIHDCARCLITPQMIDLVINAAMKHGAATAACGVTDTVKLLDESGVIASTLPREKVYRAQTPQVFSSGLYRTALENAGENFDSVTDDNMLVEAIGGRIE